MINFAKRLFSNASTLFRENFKTYSTVFLEVIFIVAVWYLVYGQSWNSVDIPTGAEYARSINSFYFWDMLKACGPCAFWNQNAGGKPVMADPYGSFMHPISMILSLTLGALGGASFTLSLAFLIVGMASYWLSLTIGIHPLARLWFALASMLGGQIVCRLELGSVGMPLSLAAFWLAFVSVVYYVVRPSFWRMLIAAICAGTFMLSGQLYYQYFFVLISVVVGYYAWRINYVAQNPRIKNDLLIATGIMVLFASPILLNMVMTMGLYSKESDPAMQYAVPLSTQFVNFFIPSYVISRAEGLNPFPYPWAYATYIGFTPVFATLIGFRWITLPHHRRFAVLIAFIGGSAMILATGVFSKLLNGLNITVLTDISSGFRWIAIYNGISGLAILTFAALVFHAFLTNQTIGASWMRQLLGFLQRTMRIDFRHVLVVVLALYNLLGLQAFAHELVNSFDINDVETKKMLQGLDGLPAGYVDLPDWMFLASMQRGVTSLPTPLGIIVKDHPLPPPEYVFNTDAPQAFPFSVVATFQNWVLYRNDSPDAAYAAVISASGNITSCAHGKRGGQIVVTCNIPEGGELRVYEFGLGGWQAIIDDGTPLSVPVGDWIRVQIPPGRHIIQLSYAPWFAWAGILLIPLPWVVILVLSIFYVRKKSTVA